MYLSTKLTINVSILDFSTVFLSPYKYIIYALKLVTIAEAHISNLLTFVLFLEPQKYFNFFIKFFL